MKKKGILVCILVLLILFSNVVFGQEEVDFSTIFHNHGVPRLIIDGETGKINYANKASAQFYGYSIETLENMTIQEINVLEEDEVKEKMQRAAYQEENEYIFEHRLANGEVRTVQVYSYPVIDAEGIILYSVIIDITSEILLEQSLARTNRMAIYLVLSLCIAILFFTSILYINKEKYKKIANLDKLTGAYNRRCLYEFINENTNYIFKSKDSMHLILFDLNDFKKVNDLYGHDEGDRVLKGFVNALKKYSHKEDMTFRIGGDEFVLMLFDKKDQDITQLLTNIEIEFGRVTKISTLSYGVVNIPLTKSSSSIDIETYLKKSDELMYAHKNEIKKKIHDHKK
ncbi:PAS domain S-box-containing protein/diguanylate cyclase (GGDEF)-like protein [Natranaerovirga hydrolytica]|uniref:PAS domain S-box-containing protein/diguanylate cyclase (GGDEF)-like protein n=1 Tax=Natranaerovirga hydrolytica TaxID=680378 RepID=A0A4R1MKR8_9FIRM|nr:sensor domain-containing diguanylate cyclase [Natranaerovirga hydrolytica]TCK92422.1 PAS domain S-box-containing protein/diguanylate cyclase (GGDEF)-like protein [Natranaerovirga hydrolytica]